MSQAFAMIGDSHIPKLSVSQKRRRRAERHAVRCAMLNTTNFKMANPTFVQEPANTGSQGAEPTWDQSIAALDGKLNYVIYILNFWCSEISSKQVFDILGHIGNFSAETRATPVDSAMHTSSNLNPDANVFEPGISFNELHGTWEPFREDQGDRERNQHDDAETFGISRVAALTIQRVFRGRRDRSHAQVLRQLCAEEKERRAMVVADSDSTQLNRMLYKKCPRGQRRSLKYRQNRMPKSEQAAARCQICEKSLAEDPMVSRIHCSRGSACCKDFHICGMCAKQLPVRKYDNSSAFLE